MNSMTLAICTVLVVASVPLADAREVTDIASSFSIDLKRGNLQQLELDQRGRLRLSNSDGKYAQTGEFVSAVVDLSSNAALKGAKTIRVRWVEQWTTPLTWKKHAMNPVYGPKQSGAWDNWTNGVSVVRTPDDLHYRMFYSGRNGAGIGFAEAPIDDPFTWKENPASPVLRPRTDNWEGNLLNQPRVVKVTDTHWRMYYTGWGDRGKPGSAWAFGLAESLDAGLTWKRVGDGEPLLDRGGEGSPDEGGVFVPEVRRVGDRWMMWYTAMKAVPGKQYIHLCLATSDDGVHWQKYEHNPVVSEDFAAGPGRNVMSRCFVRHEHGVFKMWFSHARTAYRIRYAESLDGIDWEHSPVTPVLGPGAAGDWDSDKVEYPEIDVVDGKYRMWFCGNGYGTVGYAEGVPEAGVKLHIRSGNIATPDASWSEWKPIQRNVPINAGRYAQIQARLWSRNAKISPAVVRVGLTP